MKDRPPTTKLTITLRVTPEQAAQIAATAGDLAQIEIPPTPSDYDWRPFWRYVESRAMAARP